MVTTKILGDNGDPLVEPDLKKWAEWFSENRQMCILKQTLLDGCFNKYLISTIFHACAACFIGDTVADYETVVFQKGINNSKNTFEIEDKEIGYSQCYLSKEEAMEGHEMVVALIKHIVSICIYRKTVGSIRKTEKE